jgi:hypothetical protein
MKINIAAAAVICRQVKDRLYSTHCAANNRRIMKVLIEEFNSTHTEMILNVVGFATAQIIDHTHACAAAY